MNYKSIFYVTGIFLVILSITMLFPALTDFAVGNNDWENFIVSALMTSFVGGFLILINSGGNFTITVREAFILTSFSWLVITFFAALPFWLAHEHINFTDAFFEAMSGLSTTGSTVLTGLDFMPPGILLWRSILQWLGGIGIIVMALSIFPLLRVGGMQLFKTESSESEKVLPRAANLAGSIGVLYTFLTLCCAILYASNGMNGFDAVNHAMTTIATGGFSTYDASVGHFANDSIRIIGFSFMVIAGLPFVLYLKGVRGDWKALFVDTQVRTFLGILLSAISLMVIYLYYHELYTLEQSLIQASFNITSVMTGTGYASADYMAWGSFAVGFMFFISFIGGCAGSTTCAIKIFRVQIIYSIAKTQIKQLLYPHGVFQPTYNKRTISSDIPLSVLSFVFVYGVCFIVAALILQFLGLDYLTAMSGAATAISNVGPGLGDIIGPAGNFSSLPDPAKWVLSICMLMGRLELFTVLVVFTPQFWTK
ncbi:MAG: potassium transporter TrkH [Rickettsiales bacterium]|nr:potassium transporter TrkH [Rickettsiales bacterium]